MALDVNQLALDFTAKIIYGKDVNLFDFKGPKIILRFYRNVSCLFQPWGNRRIKNFCGNKPTFR